MRRCFQLAAKALGHVAPNPMVGSVIVKDDVIIGEGFHRQYGKNHAEVNAIESVSNSKELKGAELYVNLEPCVHFGKTPPCVDRIIESGIKKVIISATDPSEKVAGRGIKKLRDAGIEVVIGVLKDEEIGLNKRFRTFHEKKRPYIILKWAQSSDGFMDKERKAGEKGQFRISNEDSRRLLHKWRSEEQAILVGTQTALNDDPSLTVALVEGKNPQRLVMDLKHRLPESLKLFCDGNSTIVYADKNEIKDAVHWVAIRNNEEALVEVLIDLYSRDIQSLIVEGGSKLLHSFIEAGLWDEARVFVSEDIFAGGLKAPQLFSAPISTVDIGNNLLQLYFRQS